MTSLALIVAWTDSAITALAAFSGAAVGAAAAIWATVHIERARREQERRDALVAFYAAAMSLGMMWNGWADIQLKGPAADLRLGVRMIGMTGMFFGRMWQVTDAF